MQKAEKWMCVVCGYVHDDPEPPKRCVKCGAERSKFVPYK